MTKRTPRKHAENALTREAEQFARQKSQQDKYLDEHGREIPDPIPMQPPVGYKRTPPLRDQIRAMIKSEKLRLEAEEAGAETFEEADDFDVGDDFDPQSPYEEVFEGIPLPPSLEQQANAFADAMYKKFGEAQPAPPVGEAPPPAAPSERGAAGPPPPAPPAPPTPTVPTVSGFFKR